MVSAPYILVEHLGGGNWSVIPITLDGTRRECLLHPDGGVIMSRKDAEELAKVHAQFNGWNVVIKEE